MTSAELCRANGWQVGDVLALNWKTEGQLRITAIGEEWLLMRTIFSDGSESAEYQSRITENWHKVDTSTKGGEGG